MLEGESLIIVSLLSPSQDQKAMVGETKIKQKRMAKAQGLVKVDHGIRKGQ
ncbi:hypothetical protein Golob_025091 [Gossypium lobatum]|uniref:Uncharacterized protein n=1 Tax=Gossypium lobatum TaxID=34289 RepID=A0A7J8NHB7_9ROSI|nr:hypothetical protein [Gossypium lobatum]